NASAETLLLPNRLILILLHVPDHKGTLVVHPAERGGGDHHSIGGDGESKRVPLVPVVGRGFIRQLKFAAGLLLVEAPELQGERVARCRNKLQRCPVGFAKRNRTGARLPDHIRLIQAPDFRTFQTLSIQIGIAADQQPLVYSVKSDRGCLERKLPNGLRIQAAESGGRPGPPLDIRLPPPPPIPHLPHPLPP